MTLSRIQNTAELRKTITAWRNAGETIGFVPTMGALHDGHLSLVRHARNYASKIVVSIFVNPTQFAPHEDFDRYPRQEDADISLLNSVGADLVWLPAVEDIYPGGALADRKAGPSAQGLESDFRPHFFDGVVSVVWRLFAAVTPDYAVFGEKDYQQLMVIQDMVAQEKLPISIIAGPIMRDAQGLALSSRNAYLSDEELTIARRLNSVLFQIAAQTNSPNLQDIIEAGKNELLQAGFDSVQYIQPKWGRLLAAVILGKVRLIDNVALL
jgi:pantoate--beta-alanine ligase